VLGRGGSREAKRIQIFARIGLLRKKLSNCCVLFLLVFLLLFLQKLLVFVEGCLVSVLETFQVLQGLFFERFCVCKLAGVF
jgi:hypothetical protein